MSSEDSRRNSKSPCIPSSHGRNDLKRHQQVHGVLQAFFLQQVCSLTSSSFCQIKIENNNNNLHCILLHIVTTVPKIFDNNDTHPPHSIAACFDFIKSQHLKTKNLLLKISIYKGSTTFSCSFNFAKLSSKITVPFDLISAESQASMIHNVWVVLGNKSLDRLLHLTVQVEPDPRFIFRFDDESECSPHVGDLKQPVFTCKFSFRDKNLGQFPSLAIW